MIKVFARFFLPMLLLLALVFYVIGVVETKHQLETAVIHGQAQIEVRQTNILNIVSPLIANNRYMSKSSLLHLNLTDSANRAKVLDDLMQFARVHRYFEQVRVIDTTGVEVMRINGFKDSIEVVSNQNLQDKNRRSYIKTAMTLKPDEFYVSPIELNREYDSLDIPYHAVARIISVITNDENNKRIGFFVTNISVENLMAALSTAQIADTAQVILLNYKGEGVFKQGNEVNYRFKDLSLSSSLEDTLPALWGAIKENTAGHVRYDNGVYVYKKLSLANRLLEKKSLDDISFSRPEHSELIIISYIPLSNNGILGGLAFEDQMLLLFLILVLIIGAVMLTYRKLREQKMYAEINNLNDELIKSQYALNTDRYKLENTVMELTRRNTQLKEFSHIISHNIRSPISGLTLLVDFLSQDQMTLTDEERQEITEKLVISTKTLNSLTEDLLETVSVLDQGELTVENLKLSKAIDKSKDILTEKILEANAAINVDTRAWDTIEYNRLYLESVVFNLLSNAIKYHDPKRKLIIDISTENIKGRKVLKMSDNGRGINLKWHGQNMFGLHKTFHRDVPGKGFGLFMTKTQIESMGGEIRVESEEGVGTTFIIVF